MQKGFAPIIILIGILVFGGIAGGIYLKFKKSETFEEKLAKTNPIVSLSPVSQEGNNKPSPDNPDGWSCGKLAGPAGDAKCPQGYVCDYSNSENKDIGTCIKEVSTDIVKWKKFTSSQYGYSLEYPDDFTVSSLDDDFYPEYIKKPDFKVKFHTDRFGQDAYFKPGEIVGNPTLYDIRVEIYPVGIEPNQQVDAKGKTDVVMINGISTKKAYGLAGYIVSVGPIIHGNYQYVITSYRTDPEIVGTFNKFLTSFKFN